MKIIIKEKTYTLRMTSWDGSDWIEENVEDIILDFSYRWDEDAEAWRMEGDVNNLEDYLRDWTDYNTDADRDAYDDETRESLKEEYPRDYNLEEI